MNLALEYLVRTKSIRNFFDTPSSLYLERGEDRLVVTFDGVVGDSLRIRRWLVTDNSVGRLLPEFYNVIVPKSQFFGSEAVIPQGYYLLPYYEESVDTSLNSYKKPMAAEVYAHFINNLLYSDSHRHAKEYWLWETFYQNALSRPQKDMFSNREKMLLDFIKHETEDHPWHVWTCWRSALFPDRDNRAACELIFMA